MLQHISSNPDLPTHADITDRLHYDPEIGTLYWRVNIGRHIKAGDEAGTVDYLGRVIVSFCGRKYLAHYLIWVLEHGRWPDKPLKLRSDLADLSKEDRRKARQDLRLSNIIEHAEPASDKPRARAMRKWREQRRARKAGVVLSAIRGDYTDPAFPNIQWVPSKAVFGVLESQHGLDRLPGHMRRTTRMTLGYAPDLESARQMSRDHDRRMAYVLAHPAPKLAPDVAMRTASGDTYPGIELHEVHRLLAYDPAAGDLIWRFPASLLGFKAGKPGTTVKALYVSLHGRRYPVHNLAWFLTHAVWPGRKALGWRNGDQTDNRLLNLYLINEDTAQ
jgi:hypothetical protein